MWLGLLACNLESHWINLFFKITKQKKEAKEQKGEKTDTLSMNVLNKKHRS